MTESNTPFTERLRHWLHAFRPAAMAVNATERWRSVVGAAIGIALTAFLCRWLAGEDPAAVWLVAPLGASAVLVFAVPSSPLAQPWSVLASYNQVLDVSRDDLENILQLTEMHASRRRLGEIRCSDIMSRTLVCASVR